MRICCLVVVLGIARIAAAAPPSVVVVMSDPARAGDVGAALQVALAGRGLALATATPPVGELRLDRAAAAQRAAVAVGAQAALWLDLAPDSVEVCAVSADGKYFRHAPIAVDDSSRAFAAAATSLLDELLAPPERPPSVAVDVHVDAAPSAPPALALAFAPQPQSLPQPQNRAFIAVGPNASPATYGLETELAAPISPHGRIGFIGSISQVFEGIQDITKNSGLLAGAVEVGYVGLGPQHIDLTAQLGAVHTYKGYDDGGPMVGARIGYAFDRLDVSVGPTLIWGLRGNDGHAAGIIAAMRWRF